MKFCVIGLGRFGYQLATVLADNGMEVMAVDNNESIIASIRDKVTQAICMRVTDESSLRSIGVDEMDTVIVAMGENFAQSILITALLKKRLNITHVIARAVSDIHGDILKLIGADRVILPEKEIGTKLADSLSSPFSAITHLSQTVSISQVAAPESFIGKKIGDLRLFDTYHVHFIGIKEDDMILPLSQDHVVDEGEQLVLVGNKENLEKIHKL
jgi:trk system potassium uptake protein TrkA